MIMKKIIAIDLDGTTLNSSSLISPETKRTLQLANQNGHDILIATGRPYRMSQQFYHQLGLENPMVNLNGAHIHLPEQQWEKEKKTTIERDLVFDILERREELRATFVAAENTETFYIDEYEHLNDVFFANEESDRNLLRPNTFTTNPASIMIGTLEKNAEFLVSHLNELYGSFVNVRTWGGPTSIIELTKKGVEKSFALEYLSHVLDFKAKDVVAFGDEHNDVEMLAWAGWGVAMKNGTKEAKAAANDMTSFTNQEDGLARYLLNYLKL